MPSATQPEAKSDQAIAAIDGGFWVYDLATEGFEVSRPLVELLAGPGRATLGLEEFKSFVHSDDLNAAMLTLADRSCVDYRVLTYDGRARWLRSNRRLVRDAAERPIRIVGLVIDVTDEKTAMQTLESEASRDGLTGLMNRRAFDKVARQRLRASPSTRGEIGLVMIDIDGFKAVNDRHGHLVGDDLLRQVARRISRATRRTDYVARIGGDEFVVMTDSEGSTQAIEARLERAFAKPMTIGSTSTVVGISFGSTQAIVEDKTIESLMARADAALYAHKAARRRSA